MDSTRTYINSAVLHFLSARPAALREHVELKIPSFVPITFPSASTLNLGAPLRCRYVLLQTTWW